MSGTITQRWIGSAANSSATRVEVKRLARFLVTCLACYAFSHVQAQERRDDYLACSKTDQTLSLEDIDPLKAGFESAEAHYLLGEQSRLAGDPKRAEQEFKAAVAQVPRGDKYVRALALLEVEAARYDEAISIIKDYVKVCGTTALGWELESELLFKQKQYDAAFEAAQHALALSGNSARMHEMLGLIWTIRRQNEEALLELGKASSLDPEQAQIRYYYGRILYSTGRPREARDEFLACLKIQPQYPRALENLGLCYEALQDSLKAFECYRKAIAFEDAKQGRKNAEPYTYYGRLLLDESQPDDAISVLRRAVDVSPHSLIANYELGRGLLNVGELKDAERVLRAAVNLDPKFPQTYYLLGRICQREQRPKEASQYWATFELLNRNPENREIPLTDR